MWAKVPKPQTCCHQIWSKYHCQMRKMTTKYYTTKRQNFFVSTLVSLVCKWTEKKSDEDPGTIECQRDSRSHEWQRGNLQRLQPPDLGIETTHSFCRLFPHNTVVYIRSLKAMTPTVRTLRRCTPPSHARRLISSLHRQQGASPR